MKNLDGKIISKKKARSIILEKFSSKSKKKMASPKSHLNTKQVSNETSSKRACKTRQAKDILNESINSLKEKLKQTGLQNEEIAARITKIIAEAEKERATARKTSAEADQLEFINYLRKLKVVLEAQKIMLNVNVDKQEIHEIDSFINILEKVIK